MLTSWGYSATQTLYVSSQFVEYFPPSYFSHLHRCHVLPLTRGKRPRTKTKTLKVERSIVTEVVGSVAIEVEVGVDLSRLYQIWKMY